MIEDGVTVGHQVTLHSSVIRKHALIGMGSVILDEAEVGEGAFIGAGSLVPPGKKIPAGHLAFGRPAKVIRPLTDKDKQEMERIRKEYIEKGQYYKSLQKRLALLQLYHFFTDNLSNNLFGRTRLRLFSFPKSLQILIIC